jgi:MFS family permease
MGALDQTTSKADSPRIFAAAGTSLLGDGVRNAALPLLAVALSPTPAAVGIVTFAGTVPILLFTLLGGALADRHDRRALMWRTDLLRGVLVGAFAIWVLVTTPPLWTLIVTTFLLGSAGTIFDNASNSFIVDLFGPDPTRLATANSRLQAIQVVSYQFIGPPLGAALFTVSAGAPLAIDAVSFIAAAVLVLTIRTRHTAVRPDRTTTIRADIGEGSTGAGATTLQVISHSHVAMVSRAQRAHPRIHRRGLERGDPLRSRVAELISSGQRLRLPSTYTPAYRDRRWVAECGGVCRTRTRSHDC